MEDVDIDQIVDIPDSPDRLAGQHINVGQSVASHPRSESLNQLGGRGKRLASENGFRRKLQLPPWQNPIDVDTFEPRNKFTAFSSLENSRRSENALLFRGAGVVNNSKPDGRNSVGVHRDKRKAQHSKVHVTRHNPEDSSPLNLAEQDEQNRIFDMAFPRSCHSALEDTELREGRSSGNAESSLQFGSTSSGISKNAFKGKEKIDFNIYSGAHSAANIGKMIPSSGSSRNKVEKQMPMSNLSVTPPKVISQKRLVRNGCISPINIANSAEKLAENLRVGSGDPEGHNNKNLVYDRPLQGQVDINEIIAGDNYSSKAKGKWPIVHPHTSKKLNTCIADVSDCNSLLNKKEADETNGAIKDAMSGGWRSTHSIQSKVDGDAWCSANEQQESKVVKRDSGSGTGRNPVGNALSKRQKKLRSTSTSRGEFSTVASDVSDILFLGSSHEPSTSRSSRVQNHQHQVILDPIYETDELSVGGRNGEPPGRISTSNVDSDIRARQLEADEMLARELQEQLYNETPLHFGGEIDESVAWELPDTSTYGLHISNSRSSSTAPSHRLPLPRSRSSQHAANRRVPQARAHGSRVSQLRSHFLSPSPTALPRPRSRSSPVLRRGLNLQFPLSMDLDMRLDILEELESALTGNHFLQRDFDENDYEMLAALDDNNTHRTGASVNQISSLPESVVQTVNLEETCAVCLESPAVGEIIRHLPCLHKFHKDCIDPWLSRKTSCPVCKSSIT